MGAEYDRLSKTATLNFCTLFNNNNNNNNNNNGLFTASGKVTFKGKVMLVPVRINEYWSASSNTLEYINWSVGMLNTVNNSSKKSPRMHQELSKGGKLQGVKF